MFGSLFKNRRRRQLLARPLPDEWRKLIERNVAAYSLLPEEQQRRLVDAARIMIEERQFEGCRGLVMTDEVRLTIAAQAALLLLGEEGYYFDRVPSVLVYPSAYVREHSLGWQGPVDAEAELLGESWHRGSIILSWPAVLSGGRDPHDGQNLVLHEFAHHLDGLDGEMGGTPPLPTAAAHRHWREVFDREYATLCDDVALGRETLLDSYGTTSQAELFAVATECFFEQPVEMRERHAELFGCLRNFYRLDPSAWFAAATPSPIGRGEAAAGGPSVGVQDADDALPLESASTHQPPLFTADQYFTRGCEHFDSGDYELAAADFNRCLRLSPDDQEALLWRSRAHFLDDQLEAALADADRACRLDPHDAEARCQRGICRAALGQFADALGDFENAEEEVAGDIHALFYRGVTRAELGQAAAAIDDLTGVIELDPSDAEAFLERARCRESLGDVAAAASDRTRASELGLDEDGEFGS
jgi:Mlc titration factor MtfA (ptsG expression regulator)/Flp pilus assembly protein TadD